MPHTLLLYVFLVCSLLLRIPRENCLQSLFTGPGELIHQELGSWGGDSPSVWTTPSSLARQALRAVPAGQLLLLPHRFLGGQGQDATALCIKRRDLVVKQGKSSLSAWAALDYVPAMSSARGHSRTGPWGCW